jgi:capsular exopolysaccharide synthesis family protein
MNDPLSTNAAASESEPGSTMDLGTALGVLQKRKWMILSVAIALPLIAGLAASRQPNVYQATASLVVDLAVPQYLGSNFKDVVEIESSWWTARETLETEFRILRSFSTAAAVAKALCDVHIEHQPALPVLLPGATCDTAGFDRAAPWILGSMDVAPVKESRLVNITATGNRADGVALLANTIAEVYTQRNLERRLAASEGAATWLSDEYGDLTTQLNAAERALIDFKKKNNIVAVNLEDDQNELSSKRKRLADELNSVEVKLISLRIQRDQFTTLKGSDPIETWTPGTNENPVMVKLREVYVDHYGKLLELRGKYLEKHPAVIAQEARLASLREDISKEASFALKGVESNYQAAIRQEHELRTALDGATKLALQLEQSATEYKRLKRDYDRLTKLSEHVGGRERETSLATHLKTNNVRILDAALMPGGPIAPNVPRAVMIALGLAFALGIALAFLMEMFDNTVKTTDDVEKFAGVPFLGLIPRITDEEVQTAPAKGAIGAINGMQGSRDLYALAHPKSSVAECCRAIRTNLVFMSPDKPMKSLLITSAGPQEGKTTTAVNLAITLAQSGQRVLIVDTDMRRPRLHKAFGIPSSLEGVSRAIVGEADVLENVRETGVPNLYLLPCGATPPNPAELLHAERFKRIVETVTSQFDRVIFDSPPIGAVTDAAILARLMSGTILVAKGGKTEKHALRRARTQIAGDGVNILGCILNDLDLTRQGYGYYYAKYGYGYGYYYAEDAPSPAAERSAG